jgi:hypothetical protein
LDLLHTASRKEKSHIAPVPEDASAPKVHSIPAAIEPSGSEQAARYPIRTGRELNEDLAALRIIDNDDVSVDFVPRRRYCCEIFRFDPARGGAELVGELAYRRHIEFLHGLPESRDENRQTHVEHRARESIAAWNGRERALAFLKDRSARPSVAHDRRFDLAIVGVDKSHSGDGCECLDSPTLHQCSVFIMAAGAHLTPSLMSALRLCLWNAVLAASDPVWSGFALGVCGFTPSLSRTDAAV